MEKDIHGIHVVLKVHNGGWGGGSMSRKEKYLKRPTS